MIVLDRCHDLAVDHDPNTGVVVLEYASQGRVVPTGAPYANRYISVLTIAEPDRLLAIADGDKELRQRMLDAAAQFDEVEQAA